MRHLPSFLASEWRETGSPIASVAAHTFLVIFLCLLPFDVIVKSSVSVCACVCARACVVWAKVA